MNKKIKTTFLRFSEILPKELNYDLSLFSKDPFSPFLWNVLITIINYLPDNVELPIINSDFDPHFEDPQKLEYMWINNCWRLRMWWVLIERWKMYSLDDLSTELQNEMLAEEPETKRKIAELNLWEGIYKFLDNPQILSYSIGADAWFHMQLEDKNSTFFNKTNIEDYKQGLREILKYLDYSESSNINPCPKKKLSYLLRNASYCSLNLDSK